MTNKSEAGCSWLPNHGKLFKMVLKAYLANEHRTINRGLPNVLPEDKLSDHGELLATYLGTGYLQTESSERLSCSFEAGQTKSGDVLLICECNIPYADVRHVTSFLGSNSQEGYEVQYRGQFVAVSRTFRSANSGAMSIFKFHIDWLDVRFGTPEAIAQRRYGITNLDFAGIQVRQDGLALPLTLRSEGEETHIRVQGVEGYEEIVTRLKYLEGVETTAEIVIDDSSGKTDEEVEAMVDAVCYLLSVAYGTKIQLDSCRLDHPIVTARTVIDEALGMAP